MNLNSTLLVIFSCFVFSGINKIKGQELIKETKKNKNFEISFGQSVLFISNSDQIDLLTNSAVVLPTTSILFFVELRTLRKVRIPFFYNLPTGAKQFIINNSIVHEEASSSFGTGLQFKLFKINFDAKSTLEMEIGPMASFGIDKKSNMWFAPILATRMRVMKSENFVMYIGGTYAVGINSLGLLYGTGTVF
ncbi:MAG: hypothetical protein ACOYMA_19785 [Bacteroidia bacterium]